MLQSTDEDIGIVKYPNTLMSAPFSPQLLYSLDGLPLSLMGLAPVSTEQLHHLGIQTLEQLACIALISLGAERNAICEHHFSFVSR